MEETKKDRSLILWILLLAALVAGVIGVFAFLEKAIGYKETLPGYEPDPTTQVETPADPAQPGAAAPSFCPYCGDELNDSFQWGQFCPYCGEKVER